MRKFLPHVLLVFALSTLSIGLLVYIMTNWRDVNTILPKSITPYLDSRQSSSSTGFPDEDQKFDNDLDAASNQYQQGVVERDDYTIINGKVLTYDPNNKEILVAVYNQANQSIRFDLNTLLIQVDAQGKTQTLSMDSIEFNEGDLITIKKNRGETLTKVITKLNI